MLKVNPTVIDPEEIREIRLHNIIDMGLTFSAMMRLYDQGTKGKLRARMMTTAKEVFEARSKEEFCQWGTKGILLARKNRLASYGQVAKSLDVVLKVAVYYCHLPECEKSKQLSRWLNTAVDRKMMAMLKKHYRKAIEPWPRAIEQVDGPNYAKIQEIVRKFIRDEHQDSIMPVQFDDYYWQKLNR